MTEQNTKKINTKKKLYRALIELGKYKSIREITVSEICREASINRSTFYLHYQDMEALIFEIRQKHIYSVLERIKEKKLHPTSIDLSKSRTVFIDYKDLVKAIQHAQQEKELLMMMLGKNGDPEFYNELKIGIRNLIAFFLQDYDLQLKANFQNVPEDYVEIILFTTATEILMYWMQQGMQESPEKISDIISSARIVGPLSLLQNK